jgi:hypothetical protein
VVELGAFLDVFFFDVAAGHHGLTVLLLAVIFLDAVGVRGGRRVGSEAGGQDRTSPTWACLPTSRSSGALLPWNP